jgi:hypothetical protein
MGSGYRAWLAGAAASRLRGVVEFESEFGCGHGLQYRDPGHVVIEFRHGHGHVRVIVACVDGERQAKVLEFISGQYGAGPAQLGGDIQPGRHDGHDRAAL